MSYFSNLPLTIQRWYFIKNYHYRKTISNDILPFTCQFFLDGANGHPSANGSGVFIDYRGAKFVITAAHVLENLENTSYIILGRDTQRLGGIYHYSDLPQGLQNREDDYIDIGAAKLDEETVEILLSNNIGFVPVERQEIIHQPEASNIYLTFGYPARFTNLKYNNVVKALALETCAETHERVYDAYRISNEKNLIAKYQRKNLFSPTNPFLHQGVKPYGISGSGLWAVKSFEPRNNKTLPTTLVGILTTWIASDCNMIATKISVIQDLIDEKFYGLH
jgi:hypothetical protein